MGKRLTALAACLCLLLGGCGTPEPQSQSEVPAAHSAATAIAAPSLETPMQCLYYQPDLFLAGCAAPAPYTAQGRLVAGMVPHHLLAADMLSGFFAMAAAQPQGYDRVIVLSPSHFPQECGSLVTTANAPWKTPYGRLAQDSQVAEALLASTALGAENNPTALEGDHGVGGLIPYIAYYFPDVPVTACLISNRLPADRLDALYEALAPFVNDGRTLLVASADASHYLKPSIAALHDEATATAIESLDYPVIAAFTDSNIDSPQGVSLFMRAAQDVKTAPVQLGHSTSEEKLPQQRSSEVFSEGITTYFVYGAFTAG